MKLLPNKFEHDDERCKLVEQACANCLIKAFYKKYGTPQGVKK